MNMVRTGMLLSRRATRMRGITENRTGIAMRVTQIGNGVTDEWCRAPEDDVRAGSTNAWLAGDNSGGIDVNIVYRLENGDEVLFLARILKTGGTETACSFIRVLRTRREYECQADVVASAPSIAFVRFSVLARGV
jgi:hypothetical protein